MPRFAVRVLGENLTLDITRRHWIFFHRRERAKAGMTTTRFVECESSSEAGEQVIAVVKAELQSDGRWSDTSTIEVDDIWEADETVESSGAGSGFTFSIEE